MDFGGTSWFDVTRCAELVPQEGGVRTDVVDHDPGSGRSVAVSGSTGRHDTNHRASHDRNRSTADALSTLSGMPAIARMRAVVLDCPAPRALAEFYRALVGGDITYADDDWVNLRDGDNVLLSFQRAPDYRAPDWPRVEHGQQFHIDVTVDDVDRAEQQVLTLGARRTEQQPGIEEDAELAGLPRPRGPPVLPLLGLTATVTTEHVHGAPGDWRHLQRNVDRFSPESVPNPELRTASRCTLHPARSRRVRPGVRQTLDRADTAQPAAWSCRGRCVRGRRSSRSAPPVRSCSSGTPTEGWSSRTPPRTAAMSKPSST